MALMRKTAFEGDLRDRARRLAEQPLGALEPQAHHVLVRRRPGGRLEAPREMGRTETRRAG